MKYVQGLLLGTFRGTAITVFLFFMAEHTKLTIFGLDWGMAMVVTAIVFAIAGASAKSRAETWSSHSATVLGITIALVTALYGVVNWLSPVGKKILINQTKFTPIRCVIAMAIACLLVSIVGVISSKEKK